MTFAEYLEFQFYYEVYSLGFFILFVILVNIFRNDE